VVRGFAGVETSIVRISETYGPGDFRLLKLYRAVNRGRFLIVGSGENLRQAIYVDDLVRGLSIAAVSPAAVGETFVMAGAETMTTRGLVRDVAAALAKPEPRLSVPMWPFLLGALAMEGTLKPLGIQPPLHRRRLDFFRKSFVLSTAKARRVLDFAPRMPHAAGALTTANWYRDQGLLR
jgi:nucleoside-diphosphate-sugar epimerase